LILSSILGNSHPFANESCVTSGINNSGFDGESGVENDGENRVDFEEFSRKEEGKVHHFDSGQVSDRRDDLLKVPRHVMIFSETEIREWSHGD
jgi:hypothetical protein